VSLNVIIFYYSIIDLQLTLKLYPPRHHLKMKQIWKFEMERHAWCKTIVSDLKPSNTSWYSRYCPHPLGWTSLPLLGGPLKHERISFSHTKLSNWCHGIKSVFCFLDIINHFNSNCTVEPVWRKKNSSKQQKTFSTVKTQHYTICGTVVLAIKSDFLGKQIFNCSFVKERYELK